MRIPKLLTCAIAIILALSAAMSGETTRPTDLPRYRLTVGRQLTYVSTSEDKPMTPQDSGFSDKTTYQVTIVRANPDGTHRIIIRTAPETAQVLPSGKRVATTQPIRFAYADLSSDGHFRSDPFTILEGPLSAIFPLLPHDANELRGGWSATIKPKMETTRYARLADTNGMFSFSAVSDGAVERLFLTTTKTIFHFDPDKGAITLSASQRTQDYAFHTRGTTRMTLNADAMLSASETKALADGFDQFFAAKKKHDRLLEEVEEQPTLADPLISNANSILRRASRQASVDEVREAFAAVMSNRDEDNSAKNEATVGIELLNKPAPDWSSITAESKPIKLADFKGRVVILDFLYRGCGWCMYSMPQVNALSDDFRRKPVTVLGMYADSQDQRSNAQAVIDAFNLKYPIVEAADIARAYQVMGFPTLMVVDQNGIIRSIHTGYSPTLHDDVAKEIDGLLAAPPH